MPNSSLSRPELKGPAPHPPGDRASAGRVRHRLGKRREVAVRALASTLVVGLLLARGDAVRSSAGQAASGVPASVAFEVIDLGSRRVVDSQHDDRLQRPVAPGSIMKIATLVAGFRAGVLSPRTRLACPRRLRVGGRVLDCAHPPLPGGLDAREALAQSCNSFFAALARRVGREGLSRAARDLGLPAVPPGEDVVLAALGLGTARVRPRVLLDALVSAVRLAGTTGADPGFRSVLVAGLRDCARVGTASALGEAGVEALAKTGTTVDAAGTAVGVVVAVSPAEAPSRGIVLVAPGGAGRDAARVAAAVLSRQAAGRTAVSVPPLRLGRANARGYRVEHIDLEAYVAAVVSAEAPAGASAPLLEALAVTARTYALRHLGRHRAEGFDLCDLTHCQVAAVAGVPPAVEAARATAGLVLTWKDRLAPVFYSADCGGRLESPRAVWSGTDADEATYLAPRRDPAAHPSPAWTGELRATSVLDVLHAAGLRGDRLRSLRVVSRTTTGRVRELAANGLTPHTLQGQAFRTAVGRLLGWHILRSTLFDIHRTSTGYRFTGRGRGHGVGLCVIGAQVLASAGAHRDRILQAYFPGTTTRPIATAGEPTPQRARTGPTQHPTGEAGLPVVAPHEAIRLVLPLADESRRHEMAAAVRDAVRSLERLTGERMPTGVTLRVHPSVQSYMRTTRQPWWTSGVTVGNRIELAPAAVLERRGILEPTIRHELAHAVTARALAGASRWVREGAAAHFAGHTAVPSAGTRGGAGAGVGCPGDGEFDRAGSAPVLAQLYQRAARCFESALTRVADWRAVR